MHFERQPLDAMRSRIFRRVPPVRNYFFFPLPLQHLVVLRRPAVGNPVRLRIVGSATGTPGKSDDDLDVEHFSKEHRLPKSVSVLLRMLRVGMRSEEHTSELQSHSFISYAVFCLKK